MMARMPRIRLFHWKAQEAEMFIEPLRAAGHQIAYDEKIVPGLLSRIRSLPPDAFVISLTRLPAQGREVATFLRGMKATRCVPIVFVGGVPEKVEAIRRQIPDAAYTPLQALGPALRKALAHPPVAPVVPTQMMDRYGARTAAQKLGIVRGASVALLEPPHDYERVLGPLPEGVGFVEGGGRDCSVTLWFVDNADVYQSRLPLTRSLAGRSKLWILWPKGGKQTGINESFIRAAAIAMGLVDYKICSVNDRWSAMAFAQKKA